MVLASYAPGGFTAFSASGAWLLWLSDDDVSEVVVLSCACVVGSFPAVVFPGVISFSSSG